MKIKFQADADFNQTILNATIRSEPLIDDDLILIWMATEAEEWINRLFYLPIYQLSDFVV